MFPSPGLVSNRPMEGHQSLHGALLDAAEYKPFHFGGARQLFVEMEGDAANHLDRQVASPVLHEVPAEEVTEIVHDKSIHLFDLQMLVDEPCDLRQIPVGQGLAVDGLDDVRHVLMCGSLEFFQEPLRHQPLEQVGHETLSHHGPTALVTKDETQGRSVLHDVRAIV